MSIKDLKELIVFINDIIQSEPIDSERRKRGVEMYHKFAKILHDSGAVLKNINPNFRRRV